MKMRAAATRSKVGVSTDSKVESQVYSVSLVVVGLSACAIGLWAFACLIGGMVAGGGPVGLVTGWFKAVMGV